MQPQLPADDGDIIDVKNVLVQIEEAADGGLSFHQDGYRYQ